MPERLRAPGPRRAQLAAAAPAPAPAPSSSPWLLLATSFAFIIVQLDVTIVNVVLPRIGTELRAGVSALQWVVDAYTLGFAAFLLSAGTIGDRLGSRQVFLCGFGLFACASAACALAPTAAALNVARALQGIGAALLVPSSLAILNMAYAHDGARLARAIGWWTAGGGISIAAGPLIGSWLASGFGWRAVFWVNVPVCLAGFLLTRGVVRPTPRKPAVPAFDVAGQVLAVVTLCALVGGIIGLQAHGWRDRGAGLCLATALCAGAAFLRVEARAPAPMLPLRLFRHAGFSCAVAFGVLVNFSYYGVLFVFSFYLQDVHGLSATHAGMFFLPLTGTFTVSNVLSGWMTSRTGQRPPMVLGALVAAVGYAWLGMSGIAAAASFLDMLPGLVLIPLGMGLAVPAMTTSILSIGGSQAGTASAVLNAARQVGGAVGIAALGAAVADGAGHDSLHAIRVALFACAALLALAMLLASCCGTGVSRPRRPPAKNSR